MIAPRWDYGTGHAVAQYEAEVERLRAEGRKSEVALRIAWAMGSPKDRLDEALRCVLASYRQRTEEAEDRLAEYKTSLIEASKIIHEEQGKRLDAEARLAKVVEAIEERKHAMRRVSRSHAELPGLEVAGTFARAALAAAKPKETGHTVAGYRGRKATLADLAAQPEEPEPEKDRALDMLAEEREAWARRARSERARADLTLIMLQEIARICEAPRCIDAYDLATKIKPLIAAAQPERCSCHSGSVCGPACANGRHHDGCAAAPPKEGK